MPQFAANLSFLYGEHDFLDRFAAAAADGFKAVEYLFPYDYEASVLSERLLQNGLQQVLFNAPPGDWQAGERGLACLPEREAEFQQGILERALPYADALRCSRLHVMAGVVPADVDLARYWATYRKNLSWVARQAAPHGVEIVIEPINIQDMPGYFLSRQADAHRMVVSEAGLILKEEDKVLSRKVLSVSLKTTEMMGIRNGDEIMVDDRDIFDVTIDGRKMSAVNDVDVFLLK